MIANDPLQMLPRRSFQANVRRFRLGAISVEQLQRRNAGQSVGSDIGELEFLDPLRTGAVSRRTAAVSRQSTGRVADPLDLQSWKGGARKVGEQYRVREGARDAGSQRNHGSHRGGKYRQVLIGYVQRPRNVHMRKLHRPVDESSPGNGVGLLMGIDIDIGNHHGQYIADDEVFLRWKDRRHAKTPDGPVPVFLDAGFGRRPAGRGPTEIAYDKEAADQNG